MDNIEAAMLLVQLYGDHVKYYTASDDYATAIALAISSLSKKYCPNCGVDFTEN